MEITKQMLKKSRSWPDWSVTETEKEAFAKQLSQILTHVETLNQYDTHRCRTDFDGARPGQCVSAR